MRRFWGSGLLGLALAFASVGSAAAQWWPGYGTYGYGSGFDYNRTPYGYPRPAFAQSGSVPDDALSLYGGYMPNAYYTGGAYGLTRATPFPSGQAYCQSAGSYLYCADIEGGAGFLMSAMDTRARERPMFQPLPGRMGETSSFTGVLATRTVGTMTTLVGSLRGPEGDEVAVNCAGPLGAMGAPLACR